MNCTLPKATDLERLPLRAVAAYAARTSRRIAANLYGVIARDIVDRVLEQTESLSRTSDPSNKAASSLMNAVADLYKELRDANEPQATNSIGFVVCIARSAMVAVEVVQAEHEPWRADFHMRRAAKRAEAAVRCVQRLPDASVAARQDYEFLVRKHGLHDEIIVGEPIDWEDGDLDPV